MMRPPPTSTLFPYTTLFRSGPRPFVLFDAAGTAFKPVLHYNRQTGRSAYRIKPPGASNKADEAVEVTTIAEVARSEEHTSELQSHSDLVCRLLLEKKK